MQVRFIRRSCPSHPSPPQLEIENAHKPASTNSVGTKGRSLPDAGISLKSLLVKIQKLYFVESWIVLAGPAALALAKSGELTTPMMRVTFV